MSNSNEPDPEKKRRNRAERLSEIKRWVNYVQTEPSDVWGEQLNTLIESQLDAARGSDVSAEQYRRVSRAGEEWQHSDSTDDS